MTQATHSLGVRCEDPQAAGQHPLTPDAIVPLQHELMNTGLFDDDALIELLDGYPVEDLHITTMKVDAAPGQPITDWRAGSTEGASGAQILKAIRKGPLWLNVKQLDRNAPTYRTLLDDVYRELSAQLGCPVPLWRAGTLLISSPGASVHYHLDAIPNILWHVRGEKTVFLYPVDNERFASREQIERICSGERDEELIYAPEFEEHATAYPLKAGQALMWPQNTPHRVANTSGLNVSLSTEHLTPRARRRVYLHRANRLLRRAGYAPESARAASRAAGLKMALATGAAVMRRALGRKPVSYELRPTFRVDPDADTGFRDLSTADR